MYEQVAHALLNRILDQLDPELRRRDLRHFYTRLGANFYAIHSLFQRLYGQRPDVEEMLLRLVGVMAERYAEREAELRALDARREQDHNWFLSQQWVGMALYTGGFAGDLDGLRARLPYLQELGIDMVHVMPILECPQGASDGGYAVSDFRSVDARAGSRENLLDLAREMRQRGMLLTLDVVVNHTSDEHAWARRARAGETEFQDYYYVFPDRAIPDLYEQSMPEIFPESAPGNFSFDEAMGKWVMTVFHGYQWDLNYTNPAVFIEMLDIVLYWANHGADIIRLDAVAFLWKKIGTNCQNENEAHLILQLLKDCSQVTAPGVLFIAEAIVAPVEIAKYFGEDAVIAKECEIAYNATFMALLWDAVATRNTRLLNQGIASLPTKLDRATWLNYVRCHDDIGLGFDDSDIELAGYSPQAHRRFLIDYLTGRFPGSPARGLPFGQNPRNGDARISGSLASLAGLESALEGDDESAVQQAIDLILMLHAVVMAFGGIPLLYYGDELGTLNDRSFLEDPDRMQDTRWVHRPVIDWERAGRRHRRGSVEQRIFDGLKRLIAVRRNTPAFADFNNRVLIETGNPHLFAFLRDNPRGPGDNVLVVCNFDTAAQELDLEVLGNRGQFALGRLREIVCGEAPEVRDGAVAIAGCGFVWLSDGG